MDERLKFADMYNQIVPTKKQIEFVARFSSSHNENTLDKVLSIDRPFRGMRIRPPLKRCACRPHNNLLEPDI